MFKGFFAEVKAAYEEDMRVHAEVHAAACQRAEIAGRNCVGALYHPAYAAGYVTVAAKDVVDRAASTKVGRSIKDIAEDVKFSVKEGYNDGKHAKAVLVYEDKKQRQIDSAIETWIEDIENTVFSDQF